jgi:hypothetical protein
MASIRFLSAYFSTTNFEALHQAFKEIESNSSNTNVITSCQYFKNKNTFDIYIKRHQPTIICIGSVTHFDHIPSSLEWIFCATKPSEEFIANNPNIKIAYVNNSTMRGVARLLHMDIPVEKAIELSVYHSLLSESSTLFTKPEIVFYNMVKPKKPEEAKVETPGEPLPLAPPKQEQLPQPIPSSAIKPEMQQLMPLAPVQSKSKIATAPTFKWMETGSGTVTIYNKHRKQLDINYGWTSYKTDMVEYTVPFRSYYRPLVIYVDGHSYTQPISKGGILSVL